MKVEVAPAATHVNRPAAGFSVDGTTNVVQMNAAAAALCVGATGDAGSGNAAALRFYLHQFHLARGIDHELGRTFTGQFAALPLTYDPGGLSANISADLIGVELAASLVFRRIVSMITNYVIDALLRAPHDANGTDIHFDPEILGSRQRASDLFGPAAALPINTILRLCWHERSKRHQHHQRPSEFK